MWLGIACLALLPTAVIVPSQMSSLKAQAPMLGMMPGVLGIIDLGFYALLAVGVGIVLMQTGIVASSDLGKNIASA